MYRSNRVFQGVGTALFCMIMLVFSGGCGEKSLELGQPIPGSVQNVKLSHILENPTGFNGKKVVMTGIISGQCPSLCEFFYKEGVHKATIFPQGYEFPKLDVGKPVTVFAEVTAGEENIVFSALGVKVKKGQ